MQLSVWQSVVGHQHFRFLGGFDQRPARIRRRAITFQHFEASVEGFAMATAAIERPNGHQTLGRFASVADVAVFADVAEFDDDRRFKGFVVHGRKRKAANLVAIVSFGLRPNVSVATIIIEPAGIRPAGNAADLDPIPVAATVEDLGVIAIEKLAGHAR